MSSPECFADKMKLRYQAFASKTLPYLKLETSKGESQSNCNSFSPDIDSQKLTVQKVNAAQKDVARWPEGEQQLKNITGNNFQSVERDVTNSDDVVQPPCLRHRIISVKPLTEVDLVEDDCILEEADADDETSPGEETKHFFPLDSNTGIEAPDLPMPEVSSDLKVIDLESETGSLQGSTIDVRQVQGQAGSDVKGGAVPGSSAVEPRQAFENPDDCDLKTEANDESTVVVSYFVNDAVITTTTTNEGEEEEVADISTEVQSMGHSQSTSSSTDWTEMSEAVDRPLAEAEVREDGSHDPAAAGDCAAASRSEQEVKSSPDQEEDESELAARVGSSGSANDENSSNCNDVILSEYLSKKFLLHSPAPPKTRILFQIMRDRVGLNRKYYAHLELNGEKIFYMAGRKRIKTRSSNYVISIDRDQIKRGSDFYVGKLKSNIVGTKFTLYNTIVHLDNESGKATWPSPKSMLWSRCIPKEELAAVIYAPNPLGFYGPRKMTVILPDVDDISNARIMIKPRRTEDTLLARFKAKKTDNLLILHSKPPIWEQAKNSYVLNFFGRVTQPSVKNFQLIDSSNPTDILMQFGRVGSNVFTMDYKRPLSAVQAFGIALSCFDCKLACE